MDSIEMESHENKLIGLLHSCEELLKQIGESFWSNKIHLIIQTKNGKLDSNKVDTILSWYGGMGSFNDLLVSRYNGHSVKSEDEDSLNDRLYRIRSAIYEEANKLRKGYLQ